MVHTFSYLLRDRPTHGKVHEAAVVGQLAGDDLGTVPGDNVEAQRVERGRVAQHLAQMSHALS